MLEGGKLLSQMLPGREQDGAETQRKPTQLCSAFAFPLTSVISSVMATESVGEKPSEERRELK